MIGLGAITFVLSLVWFGGVTLVFVFLRGSL